MAPSAAHPTEILEPHARPPPMGVPGHHHTSLTCPTASQLHPSCVHSCVPVASQLRPSFLMLFVHLMNSQNIEIGKHYYLQITRCGPNLRNVGRNWDATVDATGTQLGHNWAAAAVAQHGHEQCRSPQHGDAQRTASLGRCGAARSTPRVAAMMLPHVTS